MNNIRKNDHGQAPKFRSSNSRIFQDHGQWYFDTREGHTEGPFYDMQRAQAKLDSYTNVMGSNFSPSMDLGLAPLELSLAPK